MLRVSTIATRSAALRFTESDGPGLPILMVHGTGSSRAAFGKQMESPLALKHRLIAIDLPGHGESDDAADPESYSLRSLVETVTEVTGKLKLDRFAMLGWSLGGHIGMEMLGNSALAGLMVCGAPPVARGPLAMLRVFKPSWDMPLASKEHFTDRDIARFFSLCFARGATPELLEAIRRADGRLRPAIVRSMMQNDRADERRAVETAEVPVALVNGRDDPFMRLSYLDTLAGPSLWHGVPLVIEDAGHAPFWDQPEAFNELLGAFAEDSEIASRPFPVRKSA
jgi:pimeloyl-ACP methyl ester carboxylesterase